MARVPIYATSAANTPSIASASTALAANAARMAWQIQNQGTNVLFLLLGSGASTTVFHMTLKGSTAVQDGTGGAHSEAGSVVYSGIVTVAGTALSYTVLEIAP